MSTLSRYIVRLIVAFITFLVTGFISLVIMKVSFGNPYDPVLAETVGYILLTLVFLCVLFIDYCVYKKLSKYRKYEYLQ